MRRRLRYPTIRGRIVALTVLPVVALMTLWSFAMVSVTGDLRALIRLQSVYEAFGTPVDTAVGQIQIERRMTAAYLGAGPRAGAATAGLLEQQRATDRAVDAMRKAVGDEEMREELSDRQRQSLDTMVGAASRLERLRGQVVDRSVTWNQAVDAYTAIIEPTFDVQSQLTALQAGQLAREAQVVVELVRVREFVSREDALVAGARAARRLTDAQYDTLTATIEDRRVFHRTYVADLPEDSRALFRDFERGAEYRALTTGEDALLRAGASGAGRAMATESWRTTTDRAVQRYMLLCTDAALNAAERGRAFAYREMVKAAVVGVVGLVAVVLSIWLSVSAGRRIARRLVALRDAADVLATRQLPDVMERLGAGEAVDAAVEAPPIDFGDDDREPDEIAQVGHALNTARRAAVEAAVKQATLRRGIFAVLLNIARRNQALVHRQAKLVDTLERRTTDPDTLEDLFRIDHLTTRMRRHAEGLIILSGAAPGRRWRKPVPLVDVVAAAVGEIEDYTRVVVPPMPAVGVAAEAVADVVHLVAELVENATVFSPPHTQVTMRTGAARNGFVLEVDDRGLGMDSEELALAQRTLAHPGDFDPVQDERLGLYIVGRLAARHGITVTLTRSPYGGTTAVVLLPNAITEPVESRDGSPVEARDGSQPDTVPQPAPAAPPVLLPEHGRPDPRPVAGGAVIRALPVRGRRRAGDSPYGDGAEQHRAAGDGPEAAASPGEADDGVPVPRVPTSPTRSSSPPGVPRGKAAEPAGTGDGAAGRPGGGPTTGGVPEAGPRAAGRPDGAEGDAAAPGPPGLPVRTRQTAPTEAQQDPPARSGASSGSGASGSAGTPSPDSGSRAGALPTRVRQASLAAPLREEPVEPAQDRPSREVSPEEMRAIFGAFQRGLDRGRNADPEQAGGFRTNEEGTGHDG
ncbi:nitrate- and nitrite sensing domain-containing protein [Streptomyces sp. NPDC059169]|uniref:nitrate- and nitrite sensing domain-containing protein n=1 Tax=Streptomyces sp. NPDC059169 TaxID=3346754 RepID=UPI0036D0C930